MSTGVNAAKIAAAYVKIRDARSALAAKFKTEDDALKAKMDTMKGALLDLCRDNGADSIKTSGGTVIRTIKTRYWTSDWEAMHKFILEHEALELFEQRIAQTNMKNFLESNPDFIPAGLNTDREYDITVRRPK